MKPKEHEDRCAVCLKGGPLHTHHVLGRVGKERDEPHNLIRICPECHNRWHGSNRDSDMEMRIYKIMKHRYGDKFPMLVNGIPYRTKWIMRVEQQIERETEEDKHGFNERDGIETL